MVLEKTYNLQETKTPLVLKDVAKPKAKDKELLIKVSTCGVCRTDLDEIEGRTMPSFFPIILGHQIVGRVEELGDNCSKFNKGDRVGVAWINSSCGKCDFCLSGKENLCYEFKATGRDVNGGYAEYTVESEDFAFKIPNSFSNEEAAPLLCAGAIGYRSLSLCNMKDGYNIGLVGFGASAHLVLQLIKYMYPTSKIFVFTRSETERAFAKDLGAYWTGDIPDVSPEKLHAIIDTTPAWKPVVEALKNLERGGRLVINAIRKENTDKEYLKNIDYERDLWLEKEIKSVANVAKKDVENFLSLAEKIPIKPEVQVFELEDANKAILEIKQGKIRGAKVLRIS
ncbi:MAG: zinc-dependent alcohol dehydrogenase family protein [Defluviitoga tunisiensis]